MFPPHTAVQDDSPRRIVNASDALKALLSSGAKPITIMSWFGVHADSDGVRVQRRNWPSERSQLPNHRSPLALGSGTSAGGPVNSAAMRELPPSTGIVAPVTKLDSSLASHRTKLATSSGQPGLPRGTFGRWTVVGSSPSMPLIAGAVSPGATALTRMPCGPSSRAIVWTSIVSPALLAQYAAEPDLGMPAWIEVTTTIRPRVPSAIIRRAAA